MVIPINEFILDSASEKSLPEVTDTVDNIDDRNPWSINVAVSYIFSLYLFIKEKKQNISYARKEK